MFRISRHVTVNVQLLAECGELDTELSAVRGKHTILQGQILIRGWTGGLDGRHLDGCSPAIQKTVQLVDCDFHRIQDSKTVINFTEETVA